jgi:ubiquitin thioesterase otulin
LLGKAVAIWSKNENPTTGKTSDAIRIIRKQALDPLQDNLRTSIYPPNNPENKGLPSVGNKIKIEEYVAQEWTGFTPRAEKMKKGYSAIEQAGYKNIQQIRGDNYCGLRASLYQALRLGIAFPSIKETLELLKKEMHGLLNWNFANQKRLIEELNERVGSDQNTQYGMFERMKFVLEKFEEKTASFQNLAKDERESEAYRLLNSKEGDVIFKEALKLHMMAGFLRLYQMKENNQEIPEFAYTMFAYEETETPQKFMINSLNLAGDTAGLLQQEMCLLAHILSTSIKVFRPGSYGDQWDFINTFPVAKENQDISKPLILVSEDNRHYNVAT